MPWMVTCDVFDSTKRESTTPKGVASTLHLPPRVASYRRQPRAIECITPMGLHHHQPLITAPQRGDGAHHGHLSSRHNTRYGNAIMWGCMPHGHSLPNHGIGMVSNMGIYHHTTTWDCVPHEHSSPRHGIGMVSDTGIYYNSITWGVPIPSRGIAHRMAINYQTHAIEVVRIMPIYHRATTWDCVPHGHSLPGHAIGMVRTTPLYYHIIARRVSYHSMGLPHHSPLSSRHNAGYNHTIPMGLPHHSPLLSHHNVECDHTIPWGKARHQR